MDKKSDGVRLDLPNQRDAKRHRKLALAKEVFIISKKVVAAAPFVGSQLEALINVAEHIIAEVEVRPVLTRLTPTHVRVEKSPGA